MPSTLQSLLERFKNAQTDLKLIPVIIQQIMSPKHDQQQRAAAAKQIGLILTKMLSKVDESKQGATFKYLFGSYTKLIEALLIVSGQSRQPQQWQICLSQLYKMSHKKTEFAKTILSWLIENGAVILKQTKDGQLISEIMQQVGDQQVKNNYGAIFKILTNIQHFNILQFSQDAIINGVDIYKQTFKTKFHHLALQCLQLTDELPLQQQTTIYNLLGDSFFSKLASPLVLAEHLLTKLKKQDASPQLQIQVLSSLFILVGKYELEMQKFYDQLSLMVQCNKSLQKSLFRAKNGKRFIKLVEAGMRSSKVPLKKIIELVKLLLSNIMSERSELSYWMLSFLVNLVKKHRQLQNNLFQFPQLTAYKYHYSAKIRSLVKELQKNLNKSEYLEIEEFSKVNCIKLSAKKFDEIIQKVQASEQKLQFKVPLNFDFL